MGKMTTTTNKTNPSITWYGLIVAAAAAANSSLILFNLNLFYLVVVVVVVVVVLFCFVLFCSGIRKCTRYKTVNEYIDCIWCIA